MKMLLAFLCFLLFLLLLATSSFASHVVSIDMSYRWLRGNTYQVNVNLYRDCDGIAPIMSLELCYGSDSCGASGTFNVDRDSSEIIDITPLCPGLVSNCQNGAFPGLELYQYSGEITLPFRCTDWVFTLNECCRNELITTLDTSRKPSVYVQMSLNNKDFYRNSSPEFITVPLPFFCTEQETKYSFATVDNDGDSLIYYLVSPMHALNCDGSLEIPYHSPYSYSRPFIMSSPLKVNRLTGDVSINPARQDVTVMAIKVDEYRHGTLIGSTMRDMQIRIFSCSNNAPSLSGINGSTNYIIKSCPGKELCFEVFANDSDNTEKLKVNMKKGPVGTKIQISDDLDPKITICWTPNSTNIGKYIVLLEVQDDNCPYNSISYASYTMVIDHFPLFELDLERVQCAGGDDGIAYVNIKGGTPPFLTYWSNGERDRYQDRLSKDNYWVRVIDSMGCMSNEFFQVNENEPLIIHEVNTSPVDNPGCSNGSACLSISGGTQPYSIQWDDNYPDNRQCKNKLAEGLHRVKVIDANGCEAVTDTFTIVLTDEQKLFVPSCFTPNYDAIHDTLYLFGRGVEQIHWQVFDRWGEKLFESNSIQRGWDGRLNGRPVMIGQYVLTYSGRFVDQTPIPFQYKTVRLIK
ncbi:MAG: gliding motility-associated C-terminal domain-containing protein [Bacteroidetes bacterium]|nr:gliding motility-associated C-terminal domain-containing protein [Bacteroidota bacterium]